MQCVKVGHLSFKYCIVLYTINQLNLSCQSLGWCSLVSRHPINGHKWIEVLLFSPSLHNTSCEIVVVDLFGPCSNSVMPCDSYLV